MENFYIALKKAKKMNNSLSTRSDKNRFCSILQDLAPEYSSECDWLKRILNKDIHLEFIGKQNISFNEKKQIVGRVCKQLEMEEGFGEKAIEKMISSLMIIGDWRETYSNGELYDTKNGTQNSVGNTNIKKMNRSLYSSETNKNASSQVATQPQTSSSGFNQKKMQFPSPASGQILKVNSSVGKTVSKGERLFVLKVEGKEHEVKAPQPGKISFLVPDGKIVKKGETLVIIDSLVPSADLQKAKQSSSKQSASNPAMRQQTVGTGAKTQATSSISATATNQTAKQTKTASTSSGMSQSISTKNSTQKNTQPASPPAKKSDLTESSLSFAIMITVIVLLLLMIWGMNAENSSSLSTTTTEISKEEQEKNKASEEKEKIANAEEGDIVTFGIDDIRWRVLSKKEKKVLLISEEAVGYEQYHEIRESITWENCTLRKWLNEDFYDENFSDAEKKLIKKQKLSNIDDPKYGTEAGNGTEDKIFLLNLREAEKYFSSDADRSIGDEWWLRSPGSVEEAAKTVFSDGGFTDPEEGYYGYYVNSHLDVRPSLWIKISE